MVSPDFLLLGAIVTLLLICSGGESKNVRSGRVFDWDEVQKDGMVIFCGFGEDRIVVPPLPA